MTHLEKASRRLPHHPFAWASRYRISNGAALLGVASMTACIVFFLIDVSIDLFNMYQGAFDFQVYSTTHFTLEFIAVFGLIYAATNLARRLQDAWDEAAIANTKIAAVRRDFRAIFDNKCRDWALTPAERDVAILLLKGLPLADIAALRETAVGTVKAQSSTIFRKASVRSRPELMSVVLDDFLDLASP